MNITKCDICKKVIKKGAKSIHIGFGSSMFSNHMEICLNCGKPVLELLNIKVKENEK